MASSGDLYIRIDRPAGVVSFAQPRAVEDVLCDWASDIGSLTSLMESTCHLIRRENMVHKIA
jgi:26S proteasome regulatory subunit N5